jgi:hypothetical protein
MKNKFQRFCRGWKSLSENLLCTFTTLLANVFKIDS